MKIDFIYGELPHFSSTLVRKSPASWRAFLPARVAAYLDEHPELLAKLTAPTPQAPTMYYCIRYDIANYIVFYRNVY